MAKVDEAIEELTDEISAVNTKYEGLAKDVSDIKKSMAQMAEAANKPIPPPTVSQSVVSQVVSVALGEYFRLHPVGTTFTDEDKQDLSDLLYARFNQASENYDKVQNEWNENWRKERLEKRRVQGFATQEQIAEWAPEYPEDVRTWMRFIGDRTIKDNADVEFAHRQLRSIGDVFMVASGLSKPTFKSYIKSKWQQFEARTDKWQWWKWYLFFLGILSIMIMHQEYQNRVMKLEQVNHIFYNHVMSDPVKAKEYHDIDSLVNTQPVLKKLWKME